ncbi:hypothetical protein Plhal304r1_c063g0150931 [Plasmopara halstedii]
MLSKTTIPVGQRRLYMRRCIKQMTRFTFAYTCAYPLKHFGPSIHSAR